MIFKFLKIMGGFILIVSVFLTVRWFYFENNAIVADGVVMGGSNNGLGDVVIQFITTNNESQTLTYHPGRQLDIFVKGYHMPVYYLVDAPETAKLRETITLYWFLTFWFSFWGCWCLLAGFNGIGDFKPNAK